MAILVCLNSAFLFCTNKHNEDYTSFWVFLDLKVLWLSVGYK